MKGSNDVKDGLLEADAPTEGCHSVARDQKFVDEVLRGPNELCMENFRMENMCFIN